jgi:hypothetical protein
VARNPTTRMLSDKHEAFIQELFGGRICRGSGNQTNNPLDVRMDPQDRHTPYAFGFDGKSTRGRSMSITIEAWEKVWLQGHGQRPAMPLRFYHPDNTLTPHHDLVVVSLHDFQEVLELANTYAGMRDR